MIAALVRTAVPEDAAAINSVGYEGALAHHEAEPSLLAAPAPTSTEWSESALSPSDDAICLVAEIERQVVGYVHALVVTEERPLFVPHKYGLIEAVAVQPSFRRRGTATQLLLAAEAWLAKKGCSVTRLSVFASNRTAVSLHRARGYEPVVMFMQRVRPE